MKVILIGYMAVGKSSIGKSLAAKMGLQFIDLDKYIVEQCGKSIPLIFEEDGEEVFRELERSALHAMHDLENAVVATGGGTPCFYDNVEVINAMGTSVYLELPAKSIATRLAQSKKGRPLVAELSDTAILDFVENQLSERRKYYEQAQLTVSALNWKGSSYSALIEELNQVK